MDPQSAWLLTAGVLLLVGLLTGYLARLTALPRVTLLLLVGFLAGPSGVDLLPELGLKWFDVVAVITLSMVAFLLGGKLIEQSAGLQLTAFKLSALITVGTVLVVFIGLLVLGASVTLALMLAAVSTATDPLATADAVEEAGGASPFGSTLLGIVALDDAWGIIAFSLLLAVAQTLAGMGTAESLQHGARELGGALLLGFALGVPMAAITGRVHAGEPSLVEALALVLICAGLSNWLQVSFLLSSMVMGATVARLAKHHQRPFHAIEGIEAPFLLLFFLLAGASFRPEALSATLPLIGAYVALRVLGRYLAGLLGCAVGGGGAGAWGGWLGIALLPQAGVALGMALAAAQYFPAQAERLLSTVVASLVVFELIGPICTRLAVRRVGSR